MLTLPVPVTMPVPTVRKNQPVEATTENPRSANKYTMASPRAFSMGAHMEGTNEGTMAGAAEHFPRLDMDRKTVRQEAARRTAETTQTGWKFEEAVTPYVDDRCAAGGVSDEPVAARNVKPGNGDSEEVIPCPWITIAADGLRDTCEVRSLEHAKAGVPVTCRLPRTCGVRGIASPSVCVWNPGPLEPSQARSTQGQEALAEQPVAPPALDTDVVPVTVHMTDRPNATYWIPMPSIGNMNTLYVDEDNPKGSGAARVLPRSLSWDPGRGPGDPVPRETLATEE